MARQKANKIKPGFTVEESEQSMFDLSRTTPRAHETVTVDGGSNMKVMALWDKSAYESSKQEFELRDEDKKLLDIEQSNSLKSPKSSKSSKDSLLKEVIEMAKQAKEKPQDKKKIKDVSEGRWV